MQKKVLLLINIASAIFAATNVYAFTPSTQELVDFRASRADGRKPFLIQYARSSTAPFSAAVSDGMLHIGLFATYYSSEFSANSGSIKSISKKFSNGRITRAQDAKGRYKKLRQKRIGLEEVIFAPRFDYLSKRLAKKHLDFKKAQTIANINDRSSAVLYGNQNGAYLVIDSVTFRPMAMQVTYPTTITADVTGAEKYYQRVWYSYIYADKHQSPTRMIELVDLWPRSQKPSQLLSAKLGFNLPSRFSAAEESMRNSELRTEYKVYRRIAKPQHIPSSQIKRYRFPGN